MPERENDPMLVVIASCWQDAKSDWLWQMLGYRRGRPRFGRLVNKWFRPAWKTRMEQQLIIELFCSLIAIQILLGRVFESDADRIARWMTQTPEMCTAFGFPSRIDGVDHIRSRITTYSSDSITTWPLSIYFQIRPIAVADEEFTSKLLAGLTAYSMHVRSLLDAAPNSRSR